MNSTPKRGDEPRDPTLADEISAALGGSGAAHRDAYARGAAAGLLARKDAPAFSDVQRAWLSGFLGSLFSSLGALEGRSPEPVPEPPLPARQPVHPVPAEPDADAGMPPGAGAKYSRTNPYAARILEITALGPDPAPNSWHFTLDIEGSGIHYAAGDMLGVFPANDPDLVRRILRLLNARGQELVTTGRGSGPAWRALLEELDLQTVTPELMWLLSSCARNHDEATRLESLAKEPGGLDTNVFSLLRRFPTARPGLEEFTSALAPLEPQTFPIATAGTRHPEVLEALVALDGVSSPGLVGDLRDGRVKQGDWLPIYVESQPVAHPPMESSMPVILVAHGRAAACARAFLAERSAARDRGRNWLFVAPDDGQSEVHYSRQFAAWQSARMLTRLDVAPRSELVLRFRGQFDMLQRWLIDRSYLYVFGTPSECYAFQTALADLLVERARISTEEAQSRLSLMESSGQLRFVSS